MNLYETNLAVFRRRYPALTRLLEEADGSWCQVVPAKNGAPTLKVALEEKEVFIHSSYDPQREAKRWVDEVDIQSGDLLIVFGFGLGYHILELFMKAPRDSKIIVIEPNPVFVDNAFKHLNLERLIVAENIHLVLGEDIPALRNTFLKLFDLYSLNKVKTASYQPEVRLFPEKFDSYQRVAFDELLIQYVNISTVLYFSFQWTKNYFNNLVETVVNTGVSQLFGKLQNRPAILVSAGPSLARNMDFIKRAKNRAFVLCVGSALKPLLDNGIDPDLVISVDGGEPNYKHFKSLPDNRIPLVFDPLIHHGILEEYRGLKFVALSNDLHFPWTEHFISEDKGRVRIGPSVANIALDFLRKTGADPIIFTGQDLAYTDGLSHAKGTTHTVKSIEDVEKEKKMLEVEGYHGGTVLTDRTLYTFLKWFEAYIAEHPDTTYINVTGAGARIPGTLNMETGEALAKYCTEEVDYEKILSDVQESYKKSVNYNAEDILLKLLEIEAEMLKIKNFARDGLKKSQRLSALYKKGLPKDKELKGILKSLDKVDREIKARQHGMKMSVLLFQPFMQALHQLCSRTVSQENEQEKGQRISSESVLLYTGIYRVADIAEQLINSATVKIKAELPRAQGE